MYTVRRQFKKFVMEHDYCSQSQALAVAISAARTGAWQSIKVIDQQTGDAIVEIGGTESEAIRKVYYNAETI